MIFALGTLWFWLLFAVEFFLLLWFIEKEWPFVSLVSFGAFFSALHYLGNFNVVSWVLSLNSIWVLGCVTAYLALGLAWAFAKWWFYVRAQRDLYYAKVEEFRQNSYWVHRFEDESDAAFQARKLTEARRRAREYTKPEIRREKGRILTWMTYWPWSLIWTMFDDPIKKAFNALFQVVQSWFQSIADRVWRDIELENSESLEIEVEDDR